ncbi:MAG TPA: efflux RND transporter periplasmic adaptor subunit [Steroidobacteraceae bacterium]|jgi:RND family efflux transporter MFP subunit|nr:efflux RND transporter periplasmic adaptor subunit [Steroidobacteraceae bacterium]
MAPDNQNLPLKRRLRTVGIVVAVGAVVIVSYGLVSRAAQQSHLHDVTEDRAIPSVTVVKPAAAKDANGLELPGRLEAYIRAPIYARISGYLKEWKYDIGAKVKAGDVLGIVDTPDLDQQLAQARADLNVAEANAKLSEITAKRWQALAGTDAVSTQDVDQRTYTWNANVAQVKASQANVDRLLAETNFKRLVAPFDGVVTARNTDIGALINVGSGGGTELFEVSETSKLRIYVNVPQNFVPSVPAGTHATITVPEHPGKTYTGTVEASAQSVTPSTGTTLMQIVVDNHNGEMMPGDYASIRLDAATNAGLLSLPSSVLVFDAKGLSVAVLDANDHVQFRTVTITRDLGTTVEVASGVTANDRVIDSPPDGLVDGSVVKLQAQAPASVAESVPAPAPAPAARQGADHG